MPADLSLRPGTASDAPILGVIGFRAFSAIAGKHGFAPDFPSAGHAEQVMAMLIGHPRIHDIVAERDGKIVGSSFLDERNEIAAIGPITVDPAAQDGRIGRALMEAVIKRARECGFPGVRLVQAGYHARSLSLYLKLGFDVTEHLSCLQGPRIGKYMTGFSVRPALADDLPACNSLCARLTGFHRGGELADAVSQGAARVVERGGEITGYATPVAFFGHAVAETNDDLKALIAAAESFPGPGFLLPTRNGEVMRWCLAEGLRVMQTMTHMAMGAWKDPTGAWMPSVQS